jgi:hypothetical protein
MSYQVYEDGDRVTITLATDGGTSDEINISKEAFNGLQKEADRLNVSVGAVIERMIEMGIVFEQTPHLLPRHMQ